MNTQRILCPTDFSHFTDAALSYASSLAEESGAKLFIAHVDEYREADAALGEAAIAHTAPWSVVDRSEVRRQLEKVQPTLSHVTFERRYLKGDPVREIVAFAEREQIDLIVMGSHGRTGLPRLLMGSVAEGVARRAPCPVLIVKQPANAVAEGATDDALVLND
jgi:universal stress protein A